MRICVLSYLLAKAVGGLTDHATRSCDGPWVGATVRLTSSLQYPTPPWAQLCLPSVRPAVVLGSSMALCNSRGGGMCVW